MTPAGLPHSEISGSTRVNRSPKLIAACRVLHRLPMPRHSPLALSSLSIKPDKTCASSSMAVEDKLSYCNPQGPVGVSSYLNTRAVAAAVRPVHPHPWRIWVTLLFDCQRSSRVIRALYFQALRPDDLVHCLFLF
jgi:hypothetical protein